MRRLLLLASLGLAACGGNGSATTTTPTPTPTPAPILAATLIVPSGTTLTTPNCQNLIALSAGLGLSTTTCPSFTGVMQNTGSGCAANVRGTTMTRQSNGATVGTASWSYTPTVRAGETFGYSGTSIVVPTFGSWQYLTQASWDSVRCP